MTSGWMLGLIVESEAQGTDLESAAGQPSLVFVLHVINYFSRTWALVMLQVYPNC